MLTLGNAIACNNGCAIAKNAKFVTIYGLCYLATKNKLLLFCVTSDVVYGRTSGSVLRV